MSNLSCTLSPLFSRKNSISGLGEITQSSINASSTINLNIKDLKNLPKPKPILSINAHKVSLRSQGSSLLFKDAGKLDNSGLF